MHSCPAVPGCRGLLGFPRDTAALRGQCWLSTAQGFAFLSFCLTAFCHLCDSSLPRSITREISRQNRSKFAHFVFSFSGQDTVLMHNCFSHVPSGFTDGDGCKMNQVSWAVCVLFSKFLSWFVMGKEVISRHRAAAGCLYCMHGPDHSGGRTAVPVPVWRPGIFRNMQTVKQNGPGCRKRLKVKTKR